MEEEDGASEESKKKNRRKRKTPLKVETSSAPVDDIDPNEDEPETSSLENRLNNSIPRHHCPVCGDRANGLHYGIYTCEGCKNFFKRSIVVTQERPYFCKFSNDCDISVFDPDGVKRNRLRCQSCRYQACLDAGMFHTGSLQPRVGRPRKTSRLEQADYLLEDYQDQDPSSVTDLEARDLQYEVDLLRSKNRELTSSLKEKDMQLSISEKQISNLKSQIQRLKDNRRLMTNNNVSSSHSESMGTTNGGRAGSLFKDGNVTITPIVPGKGLSVSNLEIKDEPGEEEEDMATIEAVSNNFEAQPATTIKKWKINSYNIAADN